MFEEEGEELRGIFLLIFHILPNSREVMGERDG